MKEPALHTSAGSFIPSYNFSRRAGAKLRFVRPASTARILSCDVLFVTEWLRVDVVALCVLLALVMSAGNYRFGDDTKVGALRIALSFIIAMIALPILWSFG